APDRFRLLRHRGRRAAMMAALFPQLSDLGSRELHDLACEPTAEPRERGEREAGLGDAVARGVPRDVDRAEAEPAGDRVTHVATSWSERRRGSGGAEELHDRETRSRGPQPLDVTGELREPDPGLTPEGDRHGGPGMRSTRH